MNDEVRERTRQAIGLVHEGRLAEAVIRFEDIVRLQPDDGQGYNNLANVYLFQGRYAEAIINYQRALELLPDEPGILNHLSYAYSLEDRGPEAEACARRALQLAPGFVEALNHLGIALVMQYRLEEAEACYREVLRVRPDFAKAHSNLAQLLLKQNRDEEALAEADTAARLDPRDAEIHNIQSGIYARAGQADKALAKAHDALRINPQLRQAYVNLANLYLGMGRLADADVTCQRLEELQPDHGDIENIRGGIALKKNRADDAARSFSKVVNREPSNAQAHFNLAMALLVQDRYAEAWKEYEWRWRCKNFVVKPFKNPVWDGSPLEGKTILLHAEQGLGDTLQFLRFVPKVKERGGRVTLACQSVLTGLLSRSPGLDQIVAQETYTGQCDEHAPLLSLPGIFKTTVAGIPLDIPYVVADPNLAKSWRETLAAYPGFKVGVAWQGNPKHPDDRSRSVPLQEFAPLADIPGVRWFNLQLMHGLEQLPQSPLPLVEFGERLAGFENLAALAKNLDLVITVDTALAHLAGALGARVWNILAYAPDWRWGLGRCHSPWYPTMRLFRQTSAGRWSDIFIAMRDELAGRGRSLDK